MREICVGMGGSVRIVKAMRRGQMILGRFGFRRGWDLYICAREGEMMKIVADEIVEYAVVVNGKLEERTEEQVKRDFRRPKGNLGRALELALNGGAV